MNVGFSEGDALAGTLRKILREDAPLSLLDDYNRHCREQWSQLLGISGGLKAKPESEAWACERAARILPCLPGSDDELKELARQLQMELA